MSSFTNNLKKNDRVYHVGNKRHGKVARDPRNDGARMVCVQFDGTHSSVYVDVMALRFTVNGVPEDVPPVTGTPPTTTPKQQFEPDVDSLLETAQAERKRHTDEMATCEKRFKDLKSKVARLDAAIAALTAPAPV